MTGTAERRPAAFDGWSAGFSALVLTPLIVGAVRLLTVFGGSYTAYADNALNELTVRDIGSRLILLGPFSRDGWSHPGPAFAYLIAIPYRVFGSNSTAMLVGTLLINGTAMVIMVVVARRWGGRDLGAAVALGLLLLAVTLPANFLQDPWNPFVTVFPFGAFVMLAWASTCGDRWALPVACGVGTYCVQTHVGYTAPVVGLLLWAGWRVVRHRDLDQVSGRPGRSGLTAFAWAAVVLGVLWLPPLYQQVVHSPGNLQAIVHYFLHATEPSQGIRNGARAMASQFSVNAEWLFGLRKVNPFSGEPIALAHDPMPILMIPFGAAVVIAIRRRWSALCELAAVLVVTLVVGTLSLAQTIGPMFEYRLRWTWLVAVLTLALTLAIAERLLALRLRGRLSYALPTVAAMAILGLSAVATVHMLGSNPPSEDVSREVAIVAPETIRGLPVGSGPVLVRWSSFESVGPANALVLQLERHDIDVRVPDTAGNRLSFGPRRTDRSGRLRAELIVATSADIDVVARTSGARELAYVGAVSRHQHTALFRRYEHLRRRGVGALDHQFVEITRRLRGIAVFAVPVDEHDRDA